MPRVPTAARLAVAGAALVGLAACGCIPGPEAGPPTVPKVRIDEPLVVTVPETAPPVVVSARCTDELSATPEGAEVLERYTIDFGYWETQGNPANEVANTLAGFTYEADQHGAVCP